MKAVCSIRSFKRTLLVIADTRAGDGEDENVDEESRAANEFHLYRLNDPEKELDILTEGGNYQKKAYAERFMPPNCLNQDDYEA
ncbi:unnamed protein product [Absidia cylindrospora]